MYDFPLTMLTFKNFTDKKAWITYEVINEVIVIGCVTINQVIIDYHWIDYELKQTKIFTLANQCTITWIINS